MDAALWWVLNDSHIWLNGSHIWLRAASKLIMMTYVIKSTCPCQ